MPGKIFDVTAAPMAGGGAVAVLHDLTEIERVEKTRRDFIANVSHELRTPLTNVQGYAETLLESAGEGWIHPASSWRSFARMPPHDSGFTEDLLILAKVESGEQKLDLHPISPALLLEDAAENFREMHPTGTMELMVQNHATHFVVWPTATPLSRSSAT